MTKNETIYGERIKRINLLIGDVLSGSVKRDILMNSSFDFNDKTAAMYFSNTRRNMQSDTADAIMTHDQQLDELGIMKELKLNEQR
ncbi:MAG: hypothetical protein LUH43_03040 [Clostridia bacterium]|nr:hypothetical protein [Clostridia bacterium]